MMDAHTGNAGAQPYTPAANYMKQHTPPDFDSDTPFCVAGAAYILSQCRRAAKHIPGARLGEDPEELHDVRVAIRRLLTAMMTFRSCLPDGRYERLYSRLAELSSAVARVRDLDVQMGLVRRLSGTLPAEQQAEAVSWLEARSQTRRVEQRRQMLAALDRCEEDGLLDEIRQTAIGIQAGPTGSLSPFDGGDADGRPAPVFEVDAHA
jgi:inorganic triphosphatase YgiF